jgi:hypothetical protein
MPDQNKDIHNSKSNSNVFSMDLANNKVDLAQSIANVQKIIRYASENGIEIPEDLLTTILSATKKVQADEFNVDMEVEFWKAVSELSKLISPVTIKTLMLPCCRHAQDQKLVDKSNGFHLLQEFFYQYFFIPSLLVIAQ